MSMSIKVKEFFSKLDDKELFMFKKLYYQPEKVLGEKKEDREAKQDYKNSFYYCNLMMNNNLSDFVISVYYDDEFRDRVEDNYQIWKKFSYLLNDSKNFKKYYGLTNDIKSNSTYKKYEQLFEHLYSKKQIDSYDENKADEASSYLYLIDKDLREKETKMINKENSLARLLKEDYTLDSYNSNNYLYKHNLDDIKFDSRALDELVCENKFLEIIDEKIENNQLEGKVIDNIINIIYTGIDIKTCKSSYNNFYIGRIGEKNVKSFNIEYAKKILNKLIKIKGKKYKKVFTPNKKEIYVMNNMI